MHVFIRTHTHTHTHSLTYFFSLPKAAVFTWSVSNIDINLCWRVRAVGVCRSGPYLPQRAVEWSVFMPGCPLQRPPPLCPPPRFRLALLQILFWGGVEGVGCWSSWRGQIKYSTPVGARLPFQGADMIGVDGRGRGFEVLTDSATLISSLAVYHQRHREDRGRREKGGCLVEERESEEDRGRARKTEGEWERERGRDREREGERGLDEAQTQIWKPSPHFVSIHLTQWPSVDAFVCPLIPSLSLDCTPHPSSALCAEVLTAVQWDGAPG